jgi:DNA-directed RNA polymerase specialized sigma24 family protein
MKSDAELVQAFKRGDEASFEALIHKYLRLIYAHALLNTRDVHEAEDLVQETFLWAAESAPCGIKKRASWPAQSASVR